MGLSISSIQYADKHRVSNQITWGPKQSSWRPQYTTIFDYRGKYNGRSSRGKSSQQWKHNCRPQCQLLQTQRAQTVWSEIIIIIPSTNWSSTILYKLFWSDIPGKSARNATQRGQICFVQVVCSLSYSLFESTHDTWLQKRAIQEAIPDDIRHVDGVDFILFVYYGVDDYSHRLVNIPTSKMASNLIWRTLFNEANYNHPYFSWIDYFVRMKMRMRDAINFQNMWYYNTFISLI